MTSHSTTTMPDVLKKPASILVVEDNIAMRFTLATSLRFAGYEVLEAASADEAAILLASPIEIDLVMTDIQMPGDMDGHDLVNYIRRAFPSLPVIVSSGTALQQDYKALGISGFFQKPYALQALTDCIAKLLPEATTEAEYEQSEE